MTAQLGHPSRKSGRLSALDAPTRNYNRKLIIEKLSEM